MTRSRRPDRLAAIVRCTTALAIAVGGTGCATSYGRIDHIVVADAAVDRADAGHARVIRAGTVLGAERLMQLKAGDTIVTGADTRVVVAFAGAYELFLEEDTELEVKNPVVVLRSGRAFARKLLEGVREALRVNTQYVVATTESTQFLIAVEPDDVVRYIVVEGVLRIEPRTDADTAAAGWGAVRYGPGEGGSVRGTGSPQRMPRLTRQELERELAWVRVVERLTTATVPDLRGLSPREARSRLEAAGLRLGVTTQRLDEGPTGVVLSQSPAAGTHADVLSGVDVVVSVAGVRVPSLARLAEQQARDRLRQLGLRAGARSTERVAGAAPGTVLRTEPAGGALVRSGATVRLVVAEACTVPDVVGMTRADAEGRLEAALLRVGEVGVLELAGPVSRQSPAAGAAVTCGSAVDLTLGTLR